MSGYPIYEHEEAYSPVIRFFIGHNSTDLNSTLLVLIEQSTVVKAWLQIECLSVFLVALVTVRDVILHDSIISKVLPSGVVSFHLENCVFGVSSESRPRGIHLYEGIYLFNHIVNLQYMIHFVYKVVLFTLKV